MNCTIVRKISFEELEACAQLVRESFGTVAEQFHLTRQNCPTNGAFIERSRLETDWHRGILMYGLYDGKSMIGFMQLEQKFADIFELEKLAVKPAYRHLGNGAALLSFAVQTAAEMGAKKMTIGIIEENTVLKEWYQTHGFVHTGTKRLDHLPFTVGLMEIAV